MPIKLFGKCKEFWKKTKTRFQEKSGGKIIIRIKALAPFAIAGTILVALLIDVLSPREDRTYYRQTTGQSDFRQEGGSSPVSESMRKLFAAGKKQVETEKKSDAEQKQKRIAIKYWAPQIVGENERGRNSMRSGSKLIGILKNPIDTRAQSLVRVLLPRGGESSGIEIESGSVLVGQFSYGGDGDLVYLTFSRIDPPDGAEPKKLSAAALDAGSFTPGIRGEEFTGNGTKVAASIGLSMFSGMADTLVERESLGSSYNSVQAKPTMKNAILQGMSKASQDQIGRTASKIEQERSYVIIPEGKEMIIELLEDYK